MGKLPINRKRLLIALGVVYIILSIPGVIMGLFVLWISLNGGIGPAD